MTHSTVPGSLGSIPASLSMAPTGPSSVPGPKPVELARPKLSDGEIRLIGSEPAGTAHSDISAEAC
jgi:hypothetical protein